MFISQDKVQIPGAIYLSIKFDSQCNTEEGCDELLMSSSSDFQQDRHSFSGSPQKWNDFELPGEYAVSESAGGELQRSGTPKENCCNMTVKCGCY